MGYNLNPTVAHLMSELRQSRTPGYQATLAVINAYRDREAFRTHPTIPSYVHGCTRRAAKLGYRLDEFWLHDPELQVARWQAILRTRNIRGLLVVGMMHQNRLPERLACLWDEFPTVVTGVRLHEPTLSFACSDHHALALEAFEKAVALGYRRPALVLDEVIDQLVEGRLTAGFLTGQSRLVPARQRTRPFFSVIAARSDPKLFADWLEETRPDVIFTLYHEVRRWLQSLSKRVPEDIGLIQYEWRADHRDWAGMDQHNDLVGEAAVDMLVTMIHHHERGVPEHPRATMIGSSWVDGTTIAKQSGPGLAGGRPRGQ
jgi:LacI family transcriptional regulator